MVVEKTEKSLDWLQRGQAVWSALPDGWKTTIKGGLWWAFGSSATLVWGRVSKLDPVQIWAYAVVAGSACAIGYAGWHNLHAKPRLADREERSKELRDLIAVGRDTYLNADLGPSQSQWSFLAWREQVKQWEGRVID